MQSNFAPDDDDEKKTGSIHQQATKCKRAMSAMRRDERLQDNEKKNARCKSFKPHKIAPIANAVQCIDQRATPQ